MSTKFHRCQNCHQENSWAAVFFWFSMRRFESSVGNNQCFAVRVIRHHLVSPGEATPLLKAAVFHRGMQLTEKKTGVFYVLIIHCTTHDAAGSKWLRTVTNYIPLIQYGLYICTYNIFIQSDFWCFVRITYSSKVICGAWWSHLGWYIFIFTYYVLVPVAIVVKALLDIIWE